ncbi:MAG: hypothetical protein HKP61_05340 [Dactylosporangium sp.]|nr:hypothetical protein [Dactylosporangium sp.]NNJ60371.1 hypothetical protein [Dactylosporangium sp.]
MYQSTPLGQLRLPTATGDIPLRIHLVTRLPQPEDTASIPTDPGQPAYTAVTVFAEVGDRALDLEVHCEHTTVADLPTDIDHLVSAEPVAGLVTEYRDRLAALALDLAALGLATGDGIAVALSDDDLGFLVHCLTLVQRRWREAIDDAQAAADRPRRADPPRSGFMDIEPTPAGYRAAADIFATELARVQQLRQRLARLLDHTHDAADQDGELR